MDISIIIPVYNVESFIVDCLESVARQRTDAKVECILVDDCGIDKSVEKAKNYISTYEGEIQFRILYHDVNRGLSAARNTGIQNAQGKYIYFLDSDDCITKDCIDSLYSKLLKYSQVDFVCGDVETFPVEGLHRWMRLKDKNWDEYIYDSKLIRSIWFRKFPLIACNKLINKQWLVQNNLYFKEGILNEDNEWHYRLYSHVNQIVLLTQTTYLYRIRENSITGIQTEQGEEKLRVKKLFLFATAFNKISIIDNPILLYTAGELLFLRSREDAESKIVLHKLVREIVKSKYSPLKLKLMGIYLLLPRPFMRYSIAESIVNLRALNSEHLQSQN